MGKMEAHELPPPMTSEMVSAMPNGIGKARSLCAATPSGKALGHTFDFSLEWLYALEYIFPCIFYVPKVLVFISRYNPIHAVVNVPLHIF